MALNDVSDSELMNLRKHELVQLIVDLRAKNEELREALTEIVWLPDGTVYSHTHKQSTLLDAAIIANNALKDK